MKEVCQMCSLSKERKNTGRQCLPLRPDMMGKNESHYGLCRHFSCTIGRRDAREVLQAVDEGEEIEKQQVMVRVGRKTVVGGEEWGDFGFGQPRSGQGGQNENLSELDRVSIEARKLQRKLHTPNPSLEGMNTDSEPTEYVEMEGEGYGFGSDEKPVEWGRLVLEENEFFSRGDIVTRDAQGNYWYSPQIAWDRMSA